MVNNLFIYATGDDFRFAGMGDFEYLLDSGIKIALIYGDRGEHKLWYCLRDCVSDHFHLDYRCPWLGVENLSLQANWTKADDFRSAGYEYIRTNGSYNGGVVRQRIRGWS